MSEERKRPKRPYKSSRHANGPMLRYLREIAGHSQIKLQNLSGVSHTQISRIETGETPNPRTGTMQQLADTLGVEVNVLYIFDSPDSALLDRPGENGPTMPGGATNDEHQDAVLGHEDEKRKRRDNDQIEGDGDGAGGGDT